MNSPSATSTTSKLDAIACVAAAVMVGVLVFKATSTLDPMPGWSGDPTLVAGPILAMTPTPSMIADLVLCLASAVAIAIGLPRLPPRNRGISLVVILIVLLLAVAVPHMRTAIHDPHLAFTLTAWQAALTAGVAAFALRTVPRARAILAAGAFALVAAFFTRALVQFFIEQPAAYATFRATKSSFLAAQGWAEGSPNALAYERRVSQQEATAWFGMANVLASYGAAFAACFATWTIAAVTNRAATSARARFTLVACTLASIALVIMAGSKGGYAALVLGLALASVAAWRSTRGVDSAPFSSRRLRRASLFVGPAIIAFAILAIVARGLVGERIGELSLLFRWHYMLGALRTFLENPLFGVSPTGFKDAYMRLKPPISPEDVSSPHNVLLDLITGLGLVGVAWSILAFFAAALAGRMLLAPTAPRDPIAPRDREPLAATPGARPVFLALALGTLAAAWFEAEAVTPEAALVRIIAILGGMSVAGLVLRTHERAPRLFAMGLSAAAIVILVHAQIELTWAIITSAPLLAVLLGLGAGGVPRDATPPAASSRLNLPTAAVPGLVSAVLVALLIPNVVTWERSLNRAYADVAPLASINDRLQALASATRTRNPIARDLAAALGAELLTPAQANTPFTFGDLTTAYGQFRMQRMTAALTSLEPAQRIATRDVETQRAIASLALRLALERHQLGDAAGASDAAAQSIELAREAFVTNHNSPTAASWVATVHRTLALSPVIASDQGPGLHRDAEIQFLVEAAALAPYEPSHAAWLAEAYAAQGDLANAASWAEEALRRDGLLRLDPIRQFDAARRANLESLARGPQASPPPSPASPQTPAP
jgi:tetratricopeptide (TPR) repeat protein